MTALAQNNRRPFLTRSCPDATVALSGKLSVTPLLSICSTLEVNGRTALVRVLTEDGPAHLWFRDGVLLDAEFEGVEGEGALCRILAVEEGRFEVISTEVDRPRAISASPYDVAQRRKARTNEWARLLAQGPPLDVVLHTVEDSEGHARLHSSQLALLLHVDGERSVADIIEEVGGDAIETLSSIAELVNLGVVSERRSQSGIREASEVARFDAGEPPTPQFDGPPVLAPPGEPEEPATETVRHDPSELGEASAVARLALPIPRAPAVPRFAGPPLSAPRTESEHQATSAEAPWPEPQDAEEAARRYSSRPGTVEVVRVPDNVRPSSVPPGPRESPRKKR